MSTDPSNAVSAEEPVKTAQLPIPSTVKGGWSFSTAFVETAGMLVLWSISVTIEGALRFNSTNPFDNLDTNFFKGHGMSQIARFIGGLAEVIFGLMGLGLGLSSLILRWFNPKAVKLALLIQFILGVYVFGTFVIVQPIYRATAPGTSGIEKWMATLGLLTSVNFCYALQGGQFLFIARLYSTATSEDLFKTKSGHKMRALFWFGNMALAGLWTFMFGITASTDRAKATFDDGVFMFPPHVGKSAGHSISTGLTMLIWAIIGILHTLRPKGNMSRFYIGSFVVFLYAFLNFTIASFGLFEGGAQGIAMHTGLVLFVCLLGPYFLHKSTEGEDL